mmetsp:Transcript_1935/g.2559  ORF Transcript_1935/g.2559 Transcript_1935/m.2559 type:complete len:98 (-) Transcript_1935:71-364(-)
MFRQLQHLPCEKYVTTHSPSSHSSTFLPSLSSTPINCCITKILRTMSSSSSANNNASTRTSQTSSSFRRQNSSDDSSSHRRKPENTALYCRTLEYKV